MKISVIVPTYNSEEYLDKCLQSIFSQDNKDFEVIVVDAYSTDKTQLILAKYPKNKLTVKLREPKGEPDAINYGMSLATGDIVTYIDCDDTYGSSYCFSWIEMIFFHIPEIQWLFGQGKFIDSNGIECSKWLTRIKRYFWYRYSYKSYLLFNYIIQPTVFMRREFYNKVGEYDTSLKYIFDYDYYVRAGKLSRPLFVNRPLANWRSHKESITAKEPNAMAKQLLQLQGKYSPWYLRPVQYMVYIVTIVLNSIKSR